jgi:hypothetical protein
MVRTQICPLERAMHTFGAFTANTSDIAANHDRYLDASYGKW